MTNGMGTNLRRTGKQDAVGYRINGTSGGAKLHVHRNHGGGELLCGGRSEVHEAKGAVTRCEGVNPR